MSGPRWPLPVAALGPTAAGGRVFGHGGRRYLTAIAKITCTITPDRALTPTAPRPLRWREDLDGICVTAPRDVDLARPHPEVLVVGSAYGRGPVQRVVLRVSRQGAAVIDKRVDVAVDPARGTPIRWDAALGGPGFDANPIGIGWRDPNSKPPRVLHPERPNEEVAGLAPIPPQFPSRRSRLGGLARGALDGDMPEIPPGFDWTYFQAALPDQQTEVLHGDEWIELEGMHPSRTRLRFQLPGLHAAANIYDRAGHDHAFALRLDQVVVHSDDAVVTLCFRSNVPADVSHHDVACAIGVAPLGRVVVFPPSSELRFVRDAARSVAPAEDLVATRALEPNERPPAANVVPGVSGTTTLPDDRSFLGADVSAPYLVAEPKTGRSPRAAVTPVAPWSPSPAPAPPPPSGDFTSTRAVAPHEVRRGAAPFPVAGPGSAPAPSPVPGAPWERAAPAVAGPRSPMASTVSLEEPAGRAPGAGAPHSGADEGRLRAEEQRRREEQLREEQRREEQRREEARLRELEERRAAERRRLEDERRRAEEAQRRREEERRRFEEEQRQAEVARKQKAEEALEERRQRAKTIRSGLYSGLSRKR